jgi:hypothetical protein
MSGKELDDMTLEKFKFWVHWVCVGLFCDSEELGEDECLCNTCKFIPGNL